MSTILTEEASIVLIERSISDINQAKKVLDQQSIQIKQLKKLKKQVENKLAEKKTKYHNKKQSQSQKIRELRRERNELLAKNKSLQEDCDHWIRVANPDE